VRLGGGTGGAEGRCGERAFARATLGGFTVALLSVVLLSACQERSGQENVPPSFPPPPHLSRRALDTFELSWPSSSDDMTPAAELLYEVGVVSSDACLVVEPRHRLRGQTELTTRLPADYPSTPLVGFTVRSVDGAGRSAGYGPCVWGLRSPLRLPIPATPRGPRLRPAPPVGPSLACQPDGRDEVWCESATEVAHFRGGTWRIFPLPQPFETVAFAPLDDYSALVRSDQLQLHLSRANGTSAAVISSSSHRFDPAVGAISTGHLSAIVAVNGFAAQFDTRYIDMAGPPRPALELPGECDRLAVLGRQFELAYALCRVDEGHRLYVGTPERGAVRWRRDWVAVEGDRVEGAQGTVDEWMAVTTEAGGGRLITWRDGESTTVALPELAGEGRPVVAVGGFPARPLVVAMRHFDYQVWDGRSWRPLPKADGRVLWGDGQFPEQSHLVGTRDGVFAISSERTVRLGQMGMEHVTVHPGPARAVRGRDARTYVLRGPELRQIISSRDGVAWFDHAWHGPPLEPHSLAVTPSGGLFVAGLLRRPENPTLGVPTVLRLGEVGTDYMPPSPVPEAAGVPELTADGSGLVYAALLGHLAVLEPARGEWRIVSAIPGELHAMEGLDSGVLLALSTPAGPALMHCRQDLCFEVSVPAAARRPWGVVEARGEGFCVGVRARALWCREGREDRWIEVAVPAPLDQRYGLGPDDEWDIVGAVTLDDGTWLMALRGAEDGFLVAIDEAAGQTRLVASGLRWGEGPVLLPPDEISRELGRVVGVEVEGPVEIRYGETRVSVPGTLYR
jgi:hypothetical protein